MSVKKLAEKAGMSHVGILQIESGDRSPMLRNVIKIATSLDMDLADLFSQADG
jgi:transcriptional regulator with XRE-family HTH domain